MHVVLTTYAIGTLLTAATADGVGLIDVPSFWGIEPARVVATDDEVPPPDYLDPSLVAQWEACPGPGCPERTVAVRQCRADRATGWNIEGERPDAFLVYRGPADTGVTVECGPVLSRQARIQLGRFSYDARGARLGSSAGGRKPVEVRAKVARRRIIFEWRF